MLHVDYPGTLVVDGVDIDGAGVDAAYAGISVFGTFELRAGTISNHKNIAGSGGAIYLAGDQAIANIKGGIITNNSVAYGNRGAAIHFNAGSLVLGGMPQVGASGTDNGIYIDAGKAFAVDGALGGGSRINIEGSSASAKDCQVGTQTGGGGSAAANAGYITWLTRAYTVAGSEESYKLAVNETAWHVSGAAGDDATADGTDIKPYKNLAAVLNAAPRGAGVNADIIVMSDVDMIQPVTVGDWAQLSFKRWSGTSDEVKIIRAASAVNGSMFVPATGKNLNFENITIDGNGAAYPGTLAPVFIGAGATVIMAGGKITGNKSLNSAGGVHIAGGSFIMDGGEISGNSIGAGANDFGGAVYFYAGAMKVGGTVQIGAEEAKSGIYLGAGADMFVELTGGLGIGSHIYFDGFDLGGHVGQTVLRKSTGSTSQTEAAMLATCGNVWGIKQAAGNSTDYILDYASYYVASAPDLGDGVALGSDSNPGTATRPYASLAKALSMVKAGTTTNIYIMNNITATAVASITFGADKTANISKWEHSPAIGNIVVTRGSAFTGTMIQVYGGVTLSMNGITLDGADVNANGAAIHLGVENNNGSIVLNLANCVLKNNQNYNTNIGYAVGGAICADATALVGKQINLKDTEFTDNYSAAEGGAIFAYRNVVLNVEDTVFERNSALKNGGAISTNLGCSINLKDGAVFAQNTAGAKGAAIYFYTSAVATAIMNVYNGVFVGNNDNDNGIFYVNANGAVLRLLEDFTSGRINIEGIETARGNTAVMSKTGGDGVATGAEASLMHYQANSPPYGIVPNSAATGFVLKGAGAYYVAAPGTVHDGDDSNPGTEAAPFATLQKAIAAVPVGADTPTQIIVMSDLELSAPAALAAGQRNLSIEGYKGDAGKPNGDYTIRRAASYKGAMLTTAYVANQSTAATLKDLLWDGNKGAVDATSPIVDIQQGGTITLGSGALTNNRNMTGSAAGAVMLGEYATFNTTGGVISLNEGGYGGALQQMGVYRFINLAGDTVITGNTARLAGSAIYTDASYGTYDWRLRIKGNVQVGTSDGDNSIYLARTDSENYCIILNGDLGPDARINIDYAKFWSTWGRLIAVKDSNGTAAIDESGHFHHASAALQVKQDVGLAFRGATNRPNSYIMHTGATDFYVSAASGSDSTGDGTESAPLANIDFAFQAAPAATPVTVHMMDAAYTQKDQAVVAASKNITLTDYKGNAPAITRGAFAGAAYLVQGGGASANKGALTLQNVTFDAGGADAGSSAAQINAAAAYASVKMINAKLINYKGNAVVGGLWDKTYFAACNYVSFEMADSEISGCAAADGVAVRLYSAAGATTATISIDGNSVVGRTNAGAGIYFANTSQIITIPTGLTAGARININKTGLTPNRVVAQNASAASNTNSPAEAAYFYIPAYGVEAMAAPDDTTQTKYWAVPTQFDFYVANADAADGQAVIGSDDDSVADGTVARPYASFAKVAEMMPTGLGAAKPVTIHVMDDIETNAAAAVPAATYVTLKTWDVAPGGVATIKRAAGFAGSFFTVAAAASLTAAGIILDGNKTAVPAASPLLYTTGGAVTLGAGTALKDNGGTGVGALGYGAAATVNVSGYSVKISGMANYGIYMQSVAATGYYPVYLTMENGELYGNGTALGFDMSSLNLTETAPSVIKNAYIHDNTRGILSGSGAAGQYSRVNIEKARIEGNGIPTADGGGIYAYRSVVALGNVTIKGNKGKDGGGISVGTLGNLTLGAATVAENEAANNGGGVYVIGSAANATANVAMDGATISKNTAAGSGGGIHASAFVARLDFVDTVVTENTAGSVDGVYYAGIDNKPLQIAGSTRIGVDNDDNGVWIDQIGDPRILITAALTDAAHVNIDGIKTKRNGTVVVQESGAGNLTNRLAQFNNRVANTEIIINPINNSQIILGNTPIYISKDGSDVSGDGSVGKPYASFAFQTKIDATMHHDIIVMDRVVLPAAVVFANRSYDIYGWEDATETPALVRGSALGGFMLTATGAASSISFHDLTIDGNHGVAGVATRSNLYVNGGTVNLYHTNIINNYANVNLNDVGVGNGVLVDSGAFNFYSGTISGNGVGANTFLNDAGGGIAVGGTNVATSATVNMYDGAVITGNAANFGGGVRVGLGTNRYGTFNMFGGVISGNEAWRIDTSNIAYGSGGGVYIDLLNVFNLLDGRIENNNATTNGGAIFMYGSNNAMAVNISGGTITGNTTTEANALGKGVYWYGGLGKIVVSGTPGIGASDLDNGIYIASATAKITQKGDLGSGSRVNLEGKTGAAPNTQVADKLNSAGTTSGVLATSLEADYYFWTDQQYKVIPSGSYAYQLVDVTNIYVSGTGSDTSGDGSIAHPYRTIEKAFAAAPLTPGLTKYTAIHILDTHDGMIMNAGVEVRAYQNITLRHDLYPGAEDAVITRGEGLLDTMFVVAAGGSLTVKDVKIDGNGKKAANANAVFKTQDELLLINAEVFNVNATKAAAIEIVTAGGNVTLDGSKIYNNTSAEGAGAILAPFGTVKLVSGEISGNVSAAGFAALVVGAAADVEMGDFAVYANTGGYGIRVYDGGRLGISAGTRVGANKIDNGIYLGKDVLVELAGDLSKGTRINIAGKDGWTYHTDIVEKTGGTTPTFGAEADRFYWQPGVYGIEPSANDGRMYWLGAMKAGFLGAWANGTANVLDSTQITMVFSEYLGPEFVAGHLAFARSWIGAFDTGGKAIFAGVSEVAENKYYYYTLTLDNSGSAWVEGSDIDISIAMSEVYFDPDEVEGVVLHRDTRKEISLLDAVADGAVNSATSAKLTLTLSEKLSPEGDFTNACFTVGDTDAGSVVGKGALTYIKTNGDGTAVYELAIAGSWAEGEKTSLALGIAKGSALYTLYKVAPGGGTATDIALHREIGNGGYWEVVFVDHDGTVLSTASVAHNTAVMKPDDPVHGSHAFNYWEIGGVAYDFGTPVAANLTIRANCTPIAYTVAFVDWIGAAIDTQIVARGADAIAPANPVRAGYTFTGWDKGFANVNANLTVTALYDRVAVPPAVFTVAFVDYDGTALSTQSVRQGESATAPADPQRAGYTFTGWDTDFSNVAANLTVTAQYRQNGAVNPPVVEPPVVRPPVVVNPPAVVEPPAAEPPAAYTPSAAADQPGAGEPVVNPPTPEAQMSAQQAAVAAAVQQGIPVVTVPFIDQPVPLVAPAGLLSWSLVNLILAFVGVLLALIALAAVLARRRNAAGLAGDPGADDDAGAHARRGPNAALVVALALAGIGAALFLILEDTSLAVAMLNVRTPLFAAVLAAEAAAAARLFRGGRKGSREDKARRGEAIGVKAVAAASAQGSVTE